jgi:maltoporin
MYRGDDIHLLDFWPLDEQNTVGGGAAYFFGDSNVRAHVGMNRLSDSFQTQTLVVPGDETGAREILFMDRQRTVVSLRGEHNVTLPEPLRLKAVLYAEGHTLPAGFYRTDDGLDEKLPADWGLVVGGEVSLYGYGRTNHCNLFLRYGARLGAYDELAIPVGLDRDKQAAGARELLLGLSANHELNESFGVLVGAYGRNFVDADPNVYDRDDLWEAGLAVRPAWYLNQHFGVLAEVNLQALRPNGLSPESGSQEAPLVFGLGLMPALSLDRGSYSRPQLRLIYAMSFLNDAALHTFAPEDPQRGHAVRHFLGVSVEWWFHSSRYN